jgi:hypothetical protein
MAASGEPAAATRAAMLGGFARLVSCEGRGAWPKGARWEAPEDMEEAAESIDGLRTGAAGFVSGRCGREGGGMAGGEAGGERPADDSVGDETCRMADGRCSLLLEADTGCVMGGVSGWTARGDDVCSSSSASSRSSFSRGLRGSW